MDALYDQALDRLDKAFRRLENMVPPPQVMPHGDSFVVRYKEKSIHQALIQKLARVVSGLHAARLPCKHGFLQEQSAVQRMLDEFHEDIWFLSFALIEGVTPLHNEYLAAFYKEEFDPTTGKSLLNRPMVLRKKIRAYLADRKTQPLDRSTAVTLSHTIHSANSGFIHGASPHIMDMYGGDPPRFHIHGMTGTPRHADHWYDLYNYFFRAIIAFAIAAKVFGDIELFQSLGSYHLEFDRLSGRNEAPQNAKVRQPRSES